MSVINVSRRQFLGGMFTTGAFVLASRVLPESAWAQTPTPLFKTKADLASLNPSVYLGIELDGTVYIVTHRSEMGTGIRTSLPMVAADELDADWSRCRIEQGVGDVRYGDQNTDGSRSVRDFYEAFRRAGASARTMLVSAAAAQWNVPAAQCVVRNHEVIHEASNRRLGFGALVPAAAKLAVPKAEELQFKPKSAFTMVGRTRRPTTRRTSLPAKRSSDSTCSATAWSTRQSNIHPCLAARRRTWTTKRRWRSRACSRRLRSTRSSRRISSSRSVVSR
jgi:isoquinoline 1-oxidoreductase beta subunit